MHPSNFNLLGQARDGLGERTQRQAGNTNSLDRPTPNATIERLEESWVGVSSQPSSSSLSSTATDEVVTASLRNRHDPHNRRRRRLRPGAPATSTLPPRPSSTGSSQEEYEESESDSDRITTTSNDGILQHAYPSNLRPWGPHPYSSASEAASDDEDEYESSTALGITTEPVFTPQPNAFSHLPSSITQAQDHSVPLTYFPASRSATRAPSQRSSYPGQRQRQQHAPLNMISPSYQADHDAALRASLSTLLSCAAAARGLPKETLAGTSGVGQSNRVEPSTIRIVPESVAMGRRREDNARNFSTGFGLGPASSSENSLSISPPHDKGKRKASSSKDRRSVKKTRSSSIDEAVSPTLLTWIVSAGVVVLLSAIGFSAGYTYGKEVGKAEASTIGGSEGARCGKEAMKGGLRRLRWGSGSASSIRA